MIFKQYKTIIVLMFFATHLVAQKSSKKHNEKFTVNNDVTVEIKATNADIDVETWNENQVLVEAIIEVEGLSEKEASIYLDKWKFEALGNKSKVQINAKSSNLNSFGKTNFIHFNTDEHNFSMVIPGMPEIPEFPEMVTLPKLDLDLLVLSEVNFKNLYKGIEFDFDKYFEDGVKEYFFQWKDDAHDVKIKSKKEWEAFKKSRKYKKFKKSIEKVRINIKKNHLMTLKNRKVSQKHKKDAEESRKKADLQMKEAMEKVKLAMRNMDKDKINKAIATAQKNINSSNFVFSGNNNDFTVNGKKVKIIKKIKIKVPKDATFNLNTRHCKVKLPNTKASGKVSYGTFKANALNGGKLNVSFSPVTINSLNACNLFLNNVTDANLASVANSYLSANSSDMKIEVIDDKVNLVSEFGNVKIAKISDAINNFNLSLVNSEAIIDTAVFLVDNLKINIHTNNDDYFKKVEKGLKLRGKFNVSTKNNKMNISGKFSTLVLKK